MTMAFEEPDQASSGPRLYPKDIMGHLLMVWVIEYIEHSPTQFTKPGIPSDVIVVDVVDLDQQDPDTGRMGLLAPHTWWRQSQLIRMLKNKIGNATPLLVRMAKGTAAVGKSQPFVLISQTQDQRAVQAANTWLQYNPDFVPSQPMPKIPVAPESPEDPWAGQPSPQLAPNLPPPPPRAQPVQPGSAQETALERAARMAAQGRAFAERHPAHHEKGDIPF